MCMCNGNLFLSWKNKITPDHEINTLSYKCHFCLPRRILLSLGVQERDNSETDIKCAFSSMVMIVWQKLFFI